MRRDAGQLKEAMQQLEHLEDEVLKLGAKPDGEIVAREIHLESMCGDLESFVTRSEFDGIVGEVRDIPRTPYEVGIGNRAEEVPLESSHRGRSGCPDVAGASRIRLELCKSLIGSAIGHADQVACVCEVAIG